MVLTETPNRRSSSCVRYPTNPPSDAGRFSPSLKAFKSACQRSLSMRVPDVKRPTLNGKPITGPLLTRRALTFWSETVQSPVRRMCTTRELKRQEAIFELIQSEKELVGDLLSLNLFFEKLKSGSLLSSGELNVVFGCFSALSVCHQDLVSRLVRLRDENGRFGHIGSTFLDWIDDLEVYKTYCPGLINAKNLIDIRLQTSHQFANVLADCRSLVRSRLDLYSILDKPRSRLVKYPLMVRNILKHTDIAHPDTVPLNKAISKVEHLLHYVEKGVGDAQLALVRRQLVGFEKDPVVLKATKLCFDGFLRTPKGVKLHAFLFDSGLVLGKPTTSTSSHQPQYRMYMSSLPADVLAVEDVQLPSHLMYKLSSLRASGSSLLRVFGSANRNVVSSNGEHSSSSSSTASSQKCQAMFRVFTRHTISRDCPGKKYELSHKKNSSSHLSFDENDHELLSSERISLLALDDHAKRAWLDKLSLVAQTSLITF